MTEVVVHVDADDLVELGSERDGSRPPRRHLEDGPAIGRAVLERLACDGGIRLESHGSDGRTLDLGRRRHPTGRMGKALLGRDGGCRFPGCGRRRFLHAHHVEAWARGGMTRMDNMILLCGEHHRLLHRGAFTIDALGRQRFTFRTAGGETIADAPALGTPEVTLGALYAHLAARAIVPNWDGGTLADQDLRIVRYLDSFEPLREAA